MNARGWDGRAGVGRFIAFRPGRATCRGFGGRNLDIDNSAALLPRSVARLSCRRRANCRRVFGRGGLSISLRDKPASNLAQDFADRLKPFSMLALRHEREHGGAAWKNLSEGLSEKFGEHA